MPIIDGYNFKIGVQVEKGQKPPSSVSIQLEPEGLARRGFLIDVSVGVSDIHAAHLKDNERPIPAPITGKALIDTGASVTCIDVEAIASLEIPPVGAACVGTAAGRDWQETYPVKISFLHQPLPDVTVLTALGSPLKHQRIIALIGRDILSKWLLVYHGRAGHTIIAH